MAIVVNDGDIVQVNALGALFGQQTVTTFFYQFTANVPGTPGALGNILETVDDGIRAEFLDCCSEDYTMDAWEGRDPRTPPVFAHDVLHVGEQGAIASPAEASQVAAVITRLSGLPGRSNRGRVFMPGVPSNSVDDGVITDPALAQLVSFGFTMRNTLTDTLDDAQLVPVIYSRKLHTSKQLDSTIVRNIPHIQRRRTIGVGV